MGKAITEIRLGNRSAVKQLTESENDSFETTVSALLKSWGNGNEFRR